MKFGQAGMRRLVRKQEIRTHSHHASAGFQGGIGQVLINPTLEPPYTS